jgi:hypothetical protein
MKVGKIWAKAFGLSEGVTIREILDDDSFFEKNLPPESKPKIDFYDVYLNNIFGDNLYILRKGSNEDQINEMIKSGNLIAKDVDSRIDNGKLYRIIDDELAYEITDNMKFYSLKGKSGELIILNESGTTFKESLKNMFDSAYFDNVQFNYDNASTPENAIEILRLERDVTRSPVIDNLLSMTNKNISRGELINNISKIKNGINYRKELAKKRASSFRLALNFMVCRIPAQSMQSYMNMKIVGFTETNTNIIHVPAIQLWLQGSDFDIDKAYILGATVNKRGFIE